MEILYGAGGGRGGRGAGGRGGAAGGAMLTALEVAHNILSK